METLRKNEGAPLRKPFERFNSRDRPNKPNLFATGSVGEGVAGHTRARCKGLPAIAFGIDEMRLRQSDTVSSAARGPVRSAGSAVEIER